MLAQRLHEGVDRTRALGLDRALAALDGRSADRLTTPSFLAQPVVRRLHGLQAVFALEQIPQVGGSQFLAAGIHLALHDLAELDLQAARQLEAIFAFKQIGDAALPELAGLTRITAS